MFWKTVHRMCLSNPKSSYCVGSDLGYTWGECGIRENTFSSLLTVNLSQILAAALSFVLEAQSSPQHSFPLFSSTFGSLCLSHLSRLHIVTEFPNLLLLITQNCPFCYIPTNLITYLSNYSQPWRAVKDYFNLEQNKSEPLGTLS